MTMALQVLTHSNKAHATKEKLMTLMLLKSECMYLLFGHSLENSPKSASKRVENRMDKGKAQISEADDKGFIEVKRKKVGATGSKVTTTGTQEEGQCSVPLVERINVLEKQILEGKLVFVDDDGKSLEKVDYLDISDSDDEVGPVENKNKTTGAKKEWGLSPKAKVRVLHTAQLDVTTKFELVNGIYVVVTKVPIKCKKELNRDNPGLGAGLLDAVRYTKGRRHKQLWTSSHKSGGRKTLGLMARIACEEYVILHTQERLEGEECTKIPRGNERKLGNE
nr:hypothetical protein [Tanacetum cinerariifolium]